LSFKKRYYEVDEVCYVKPEKKLGKILELNVKPDEKVYKAYVEFKDTDSKGNQTKYAKEFNLWELQKDRSKKKSHPIGLNKSYFQVRNFHEAFGHPVADIPQPMDKDLAQNRTHWTVEEQVELLFASVGGDEKEFNESVDTLIDSIKSTAKKVLVKNSDVDQMSEKEIIAGQVDALIDSIYFIMGSFVSMGVRPERFFDIVQDANMGKLHNIDGKLKPVYRADGKIQKPDGWKEDFAPEGKIEKEIEYQSKKAQEKQK